MNIFVGDLRWEGYHREKKQYLNTQKRTNNNLRVSIFFKKTWVVWVNNSDGFMRNTIEYRFTVTGLALREMGKQ